MRTLLVLALVPFALTAAQPSLPGARGCPIFPASNVWNTPVDGLPVAADSAALIGSIGRERGLHADFAHELRYGIPYNVASQRTPRYQVSFEYGDESDHLRYPIPPHVRQEGGGDAHIIVVDRDRCRLTELYAAQHVNGRWKAGSGASWNLRSNKLRPDGWTSADAAGLPILPGLVRYDEVARGEIRHAIRFTAEQTRKAHIYPARHDAGSSDDPALPPMGARVRLRASYDISKLPRPARVIAKAMQVYGMILADNGSNWYFSGASDRHFNDDTLHALDVITGGDFEVVDTSTLRNG